MNEIEHKFFKTFEIRPRANYGFSAEGKRIDSLELYPPEITDRILLELTCILNDWCIGVPMEVTYSKLKESILNECISHVSFSDNFKQQIQALFQN